MMEIYILGSYLAMLIYAFFLEFDSFREYITMLLECININVTKKVHPYSLMVSFSLILILTSWLGFIVMIALLCDYIGFIYKNKEVKE